MAVVIHNPDDGSIIAVHLNRSADDVSVLDGRDRITADWDRDWDPDDKRVVDKKVVDKS